MVLMNTFKSLRIYQGWWIVGTLFAASAMAVGSSQYAFSIFVQPLQDEFGWSRTQINVSLSFAALGSLASPFWGKMIDQYGSKYVMVFCLCVSGLSYITRPLIDELWHFYAMSALQFVGFAGTAQLPAGKLIGTWFQKARGRVMGLTMMGNNFGGLIVPIIVGVTISFYSWEFAYIVLGATTIGVAFISIITIKDIPDKTTPVTISGTSGVNEQYTYGGLSIREALTRKSFYMITGAIICGTFTYATVLPQVFVHLTNEGASFSTAAQALSALAIFGMAGKLIFGYLAERITARYSLILCLAGQSMFLLLMLWSSNNLVLWTSVPMFGLCMGAFGALMSLIVQEGFGIKHFGSVMGLILLTSVVPFSIGPIIAGMSFDHTGHYHSAFISVTAMFLLAIVLLIQAGAPEFRVEPEAEFAD